MCLGPTEVSYKRLTNGACYVSVSFQNRVETCLSFLMTHVRLIPCAWRPASQLSVGG
ncbi:hypothetical protein M758_10G119600 [Ceratodon purpureus]|nr:hypothetical protein M758_10G119600 [Ceratodon purpureus]